jgi:hypothetical protein
LGLKGRRDKAFVMTKVCTHGRDGSLAMQMRNNRCVVFRLTAWTSGRFTASSFRMILNYSFVPWSCRGAAQSEEQGKGRFVGFTGHKDPDVYLPMLHTGCPFDSVQMPLNAFDATYFMSFEQKVSPVLNQRVIAQLGMKTISGHGEPVQMGVVTAAEALPYAMSLAVACTISGPKGCYSRSLKSHNTLC